VRFSISLANQDVRFRVRGQHGTRAFG
jgi:hypothetical protein